MYTASYILAENIHLELQAIIRPIIMDNNSFFGFTKIKS